MEEKQITEKTSETQTYKFMHCKTCKTETRFISTLSPTGDWVCCRCGSRVSDKPWKLDTSRGDCRIVRLEKGNENGKIKPN